MKVVKSVFRKKKGFSMKFSKNLMVVAVLLSTHAVVLFGRVARPGVVTAPRSAEEPKRPTEEIKKPIGPVSSSRLIPSALDPVFQHLTNYLNKPALQRTSNDLNAMKNSLRLLESLMKKEIQLDMVRLEAEKAKKLSPKYQFDKYMNDLKEDEKFWGGENQFIPSDVWFTLVNKVLVKLNDDSLKNKAISTALAMGRQRALDEGLDMSVERIKEMEKLIIDKFATAQGGDEPELTESSGLGQYVEEFYSAIGSVGQLVGKLETMEMNPLNVELLQIRNKVESLVAKRDFHELSSDQKSEIRDFINLEFTKAINVSGLSQLKRQRLAQETNALVNMIK